jgi:vancomycin resistance protein YoaR
LRTAVLIVGGTLAVVGGAYVAGYYLAADLLPRNTVISDVAVGGLTREAAAEKLESALAAKASAPITLTIGGKQVELSPTELGMGIDYDQSVLLAGGGRYSWNPADIMLTLFGGNKLDATVTMDDAALKAKVTALAADVDTESKDASLAYVAGEPQITPGADGLQVDVAGTVDAIKAAYLKGEVASAVQHTVTPDITTATAEQTAEDVAKPAIREPIRVQVGDKGEVTIAPEDVAATLTFSKVGDKLVPHFDAQKLGEALDKQLEEIGLEPPVDAKITIGQKKSDKPKIVDAKDGEGIDTDELADELLDENGQVVHAVSVGIAERPAAFDKAAAEAMGVKEITGEFTTYFPGSAYRYNNIGKAAKLINGTFLAPGEEFSMNATLGERTPQAGWMKGGGIANGKIDPNIYGGGISQATTTTFNAIFFAGLKDIYHKPHSLYFSRYPMGREATLDWKSVDMKFQNDTEYGVLLQAWITGSTGRQGSITVRVWSTKKYTVKASKPVTSNYRSPGPTQYNESKSCVAQSPMSGFDVKYKRLFYEGKTLVKTENFKWSYNTLAKVVCGKKPK